MFLGLKSLATDQFLGNVVYSDIATKLSTPLKPQDIIV